ncbi:MAG: methyltransferase [Xanthomonadales bacterium]|nr:methyltransferase [Xanthomonadales bacterium]
MSTTMAADDAAAAALFVPFSQAVVAWPPDQRVLFLGARDGIGLRSAQRSTWLCQQSFKPFAEPLLASGATLREPADDERFDVVLLLPSRQRDLMRAEFARGVQHLTAKGTLLTSVANTQGAKSAQADLEALAGPTQQLSKFKSRVFWLSPQATAVNQVLAQSWLARSAIQAIADGAYVSRPGLFAWDRIDAASALLAEHLPEDIAGCVADLGAGYGYLASQVAMRCAGVTQVDLYEAEARALEPARINMRQALSLRESEASFELCWHDVTRGLPQRYDVIVSNPPFHQGRADQPELGRAFIRSAAQALQADGRFFMVANRHLAYETTLDKHFAQVITLATQQGFKVFQASGPRP